MTGYQIKAFWSKIYDSLALAVSKNLFGEALESKQYRYHLHTGLCSQTGYQRMEAYPIGPDKMIIAQVFSNVAAAGMNKHLPNIKMDRNFELTEDGTKKLVLTLAEAKERIQAFEDELSAACNKQPSDIGVSYYPA